MKLQVELNGQTANQTLAQLADHAMRQKPQDFGQSLRLELARAKRHATDALFAGRIATAIESVNQCFAIEDAMLKARRAAFLENVNTNIATMAGKPTSNGNGEIKAIRVS